MNLLEHDQLLVESLTLLRYRRIFGRSTLPVAVNRHSRRSGDGHVAAAASSASLVVWTVWDGHPGRTPS
jgi:hypothetical protein